MSIWTWLSGLGRGAASENPDSGSSGQETKRGDSTQDSESRSRDQRTKRGDPAQDPYLGSPGRQTERAIRVLVFIGVASLIAIILAGIVNGGGVRFVIWALIAALSATVVGGALGLLFGLPTSQVGPAPVVVVPPPSQPAPVAPVPLANQPATPTPTSLATPVTAPTSTPASEQRALDIGYRDSTSLEQVADWLTKIIVGLTLTQFPSWEMRFEAMARNLTEAMVGPLGRSGECLEVIRSLTGAERLTALTSSPCQIPPSSAVPGGVLIALGATIGFLVSYLWMRRYFILEMVVAKRVAENFLNVREARAKSDVAAEAEQQVKSELMATKAAAKAAEEKLKTDLELVRAEAALQKADLNRVQVEAALQLERVQAEAALQKAEEAKQRAQLEEALRAATKRGRVQTTEEQVETPAGRAVNILKKGEGLLPPSSEGLKKLAAIEKTILEKSADPHDPWRGKFGEQATANGVTLAASVSTTTDPATFRVELVVHTVDMPPPEALVGTKALFYLHPTFGDAPRVSTLGADGRAPLELYAYGAFTVGVITESGTMLELNLATLAEAPDTFRTR